MSRRAPFRERTLAHQFHQHAQGSGMRSHNQRPRKSSLSAIILTRGRADATTKGTKSHNMAIIYSNDKNKVNKVKQTTTRQDLRNSLFTRLTRTNTKRLVVGTQPGTRICRTDYRANAAGLSKDYMPSDMFDTLIGSSHYQLQSSDRLVMVSTILFGHNKTARTPKPLSSFAACPDGSENRTPNPIHGLVCGYRGDIALARI
jgi:hypothetical protein